MIHLRNIRALPHDLPRDALELIVLLLRLVVALLQLRHRPKVELVTLQQHLPVVRSTRFDRFSHESALAPASPCSPRNKASSSSHGVSSIHDLPSLIDSAAVFKQVLRVTLLSRVKSP